MLSLVNWHILSTEYLAQPLRIISISGGLSSEETARKPGGFPCHVRYCALSRVRHTLSRLCRTNVQQPQRHSALWPLTTWRAGNWVRLAQYAADHDTDCRAQ